MFHYYIIGDATEMDFQIVSKKVKADIRRKINGICMESEVLVYCNKESSAIHDFAITYAEVNSHTSILYECSSPTNDNFECEKEIIDEVVEKKEKAAVVIILNRDLPRPHTLVSYAKERGLNFRVIYVD